MRRLMILASLAALSVLITVLVARLTGDQASAVMIVLLALVTIASLFSRTPSSSRPTRNLIAGN